jgi:hypothetical protein
MWLEIPPQLGLILIEIAGAENSREANHPDYGSRRLKKRSLNFSTTPLEYFRDSLHIVSYRQGVEQPISGRLVRVQESESKANKNRKKCWQVC